MFLVAPAPDFFQSDDSGSGYFFKKVALALCGAGSATRLLAKFDKKKIPHKLPTNVKLQEILKQLK